MSLDNYEIVEKTESVPSTTEANFYIELYAPEGKAVVGGGYLVNGEALPQIKQNSFVEFDEFGVSHGWGVFGRNETGYTVSITVKACCVTI